MDAHEPGLFDLPDRESPAPPKRLQYGRNRESWARTATAEVTIIDAEALHEAAAWVRESAVTIGIRAASTSRAPSSAAPTWSPPTTRSTQWAGWSGPPRA